MALLRIIDKIYFMTKNIEINVEELNNEDITLDELNTDYLTDAIYYILSDSDEYRRNLLLYQRNL